MNESHKDNSKLSLLTLTVLLTASVLVGFGLQVYRSYREHVVSLKRVAKVEALRGTIIYLDEVLTMSARMAATTGDPKWEARYRQHENILDVAIKDAIRTVPQSVVGETASQTDEANIKLVQMENRSFEHVRRGEMEQARVVLFSPEYEEQKRIYAEGMTNMNSQLARDIQATVSAERQRALRQLYGMGLVGVMLMLIWITVVRQTQHWRRRLAEQNAALAGQADQLRELNRTLDQKVAERTKQLEESQVKVLQSEKMSAIGQLAGSVAHDLNNQLTPVRGYLDMLLADMKPGDPVHGILSEVNQAAIHSIEIVQRLLNFSKPSSMKKELIRLEPLVEEIKKILPQLLPSSIETHVVIEPDLWPVNGNATELQTVIVNLIANARDAMPEGGKLTIRVERAYGGSVTVSHGVLAKPCVAVSVVDSGTGMTPEVLRRVFEPFFSTKGRTKGTGLGLSMAFNIVKAHDGWVDVSTELGKGSSFQLYLPAALDAGELMAAAPTAAQAAGLPQGSGLILFVDDEERIRTMGKIFLESLGYTMIFAKDGAEAVKKYSESQASIAAVVSDMTMPNMNGRQMLKEILQINPSAVVVLSSGYTEEGTHDELIAAGATDFIQKPYTIQILAEGLQKALLKHGKTPPHA